MLQKLIATFGSRKFLAALMGTIAAAAAAYAAHTPLSLELVEKILAPLYAWAVVEGGLDLARILNPGQPAPAPNPLDGPLDKTVTKTASGERNVVGLKDAPPAG